MFHQTIVYGRVGKDPEVRFTNSGQAVANFSVAVTEKYKDKEHTVWYDVQAWSKLAELCGEFVAKGDLILVSGRMNCREWEDREGVKRRSWELIANNIQFASKSRSSNGGEPSHGHQEPSPGGSFEDDDIPF